MTEDAKSADGRPVVGFVGLGRMGMLMARNIVAAGYELVGFDLSAERMAEIVEAGAVPAESAADVVRKGAIVMTSLPSSAVTVKVARGDLLPSARSGQVFLDMGTTEAPETRVLSAEFREKGAEFLDCPVSGRPGPTMRVFVGGKCETADSVMPILKATADPERVVYCGESGTGQAVKAVNQLGMGLVDAAILEAVAFGVRAGADVDAIIQGVGGEEGWRNRLAEVARSAKEGRADDVYVKFPELPYFLKEAAERGFESPLTSALFEFLDGGPRNWKDNMDRPRVAMWHQLMSRGGDCTMIDPMDATRRKTLS